MESDRLSTLEALLIVYDVKECLFNLNDLFNFFFLYFIYFRRNLQALPFNMAWKIDE